MKLVESATRGISSAQTPDPDSPSSCQQNSRDPVIFLSHVTDSSTSHQYLNRDIAFVAPHFRRSELTPLIVADCDRRRRNIAFAPEDEMIHPFFRIILPTRRL
jgi:hypothetical protein